MILKTVTMAPNRNQDDDPGKIFIGKGNENAEDRNDKETSEDVNHSEPLVDGHLLSQKLGQR